MADLPGPPSHNGHGDGRGRELDTWLTEPVRPLLPPPGAFEQVRRRARRRKLRQAAWSAAGAALIVAAAVTVPRLVIPQLGHGRPLAGKLSASNHGTQPAQPTTPASGTILPSPLVTRSSRALTKPPAPPNFQPTSVTFDSPGTGWVIGQAGTPGHCGPPNPDICTSIARTDNAGKTWYGVRAPVAGPATAGQGVGQIRFLNGRDGWAFGPQLWATHDGGQHWTRIKTGGLRVTALETVDGRVFAVWADCIKRGAPSVFGGCQVFYLYSSPAGSNDWAQVPPEKTGWGGNKNASAPLVLAGSNVYLLAPDGQLLAGPVTGTGMHIVTSHAPCDPGTEQPDGHTAGALLAAVGSSGTGLAMLCPGPAGGSVQQKMFFYSADGGATWQREGTAPAAGVATSLAGTPSGAVVLATTQGIDAAADPGAPWQSAVGTSVPGGFTYVGMTTSQQGVAVPADTGLHAVWFSYDGGPRWQKSAIP
jgi:hypothetical protein